MLQKYSYVVPCDKCGVLWVSIFHLYSGFSRKVSTIGEFVKVSVKVIEPENWIKKKSKLKGVIVRTKKKKYKIDGSAFSFYDNNLVLLKKKINPVG